jgi:hypothetical protein
MDIKNEIPGSYISMVLKWVFYKKRTNHHPKLPILWSFLEITEPEVL